MKLSVQYIHCFGEKQGKINNAVMNQSSPMDPETKSEDSVF